MLRAILHRLVSVPWVYDFSQVVAGVRKVHGRLAGRVALAKEGISTVLDTGGGTGLARGLWSPGVTYICLDVEFRKLLTFHERSPADSVVQGDASRMPVASMSIDAVVCVFILHHLDDAAASACLAECARVLKPTGRVLVLDPIWAPERRRGRFLWRFDRGGYPRTESAITSLVAQRLRVDYLERFAVHHAYLLCEAVKRPTV